MGIGDVEMVMNINLNMKNNGSKLRKIKLNCISSDMIIDLQFFIV